MNSVYLERIRAAPASSFLRLPRSVDPSAPTLLEALFPPKGPGRKRARAFDPPPRTAPLREEDAFEEFPKLDHVKRDEKHKRWTARWVDKDRARRYRHYSDRKEGSKEASYAQVKAFVAGLNPPPPQQQAARSPPPLQTQAARPQDPSFAEMMAALHARLDAKGVPRNPSFAAAK
jgi:hypothetical protein